MTATIGNVCISEYATIDATNITYGSARIGIEQTLLQTRHESAAGRPQFIAAFRTYYPNVLDHFTFALPFETNDEQATQNEFLRKLKKSGGVHTFCPWREEYEQWGALAGDAVFQLPRPNAAYLLSRSEVTYAVRFFVNGVEETVTMKDTVTAATAVTAGQVWCDRNTGLTKRGTALATDATVSMRYWPLFHVVVLPAGAIDLTIPYMETIDLLLVEVEPD